MEQKANRCDSTQHGPKRTENGRIFVCLSQHFSEFENSSQIRAPRKRRTMSDFASLLSELDKSAKTKKATSKNNKRVNPTEFRKRSQTSEGEGQSDSGSRKRQRRKPHDASELTIQLSFLCIGAQKAGTSWLHEMLQNIPSLGLPKQKEVHFWDWNRARGLSWYSRQFPTGQKLLYGEITPCYMTLSDQDIQEIHALFPNLRIVFVARNLVDRAWSALTMELRNNAQGMQAGQFALNENSSLDAVTRNRVDKESDPDKQTNEYYMNRLEHSTHSQRNDYAKALRQWLECFSPEQILILNYDEISSNPKGTIRRVLEHIGADGEAVSNLSMEKLTQKVNTATKPRPIRPSLRKQMEAYLRLQAKEFNKLLQELGYDWTLDEYE